MEVTSIVGREMTVFVQHKDNLDKANTEPHNTNPHPQEIAANTEYFEGNALVSIPGFCLQSFIQLHGICQQKLKAETLLQVRIYLVGKLLKCSFRQEIEILIFHPTTGTQL